MSDKQFEFIDEEKEISGEEYTPDEFPPTSDESETTQSAETPEHIAMVGEQKFDSVDDLTKFAEEKDKSYQNAQQLIGRQGNELGELRNAIEQLNENLQPKQAEAPVPELDPYDSDSVKQYLSYEKGKIKEEIMETLDKKRRAENVQTARRMDVENFIVGHPDVSEDDLSQIAKYGDGRGVNRFEDAYRLMQYEKIQKKLDDIETQKQTGKVADASNVPNTLSGVSGGNREDIDYDSISPEEWAKLPDDVRKRALMES